MLLYRIRHKDNGKFFGGLAYPWAKTGHEIWNDKGAFFKDIDTIENWLKVLCSDWKNPKWKFGYCNHWTAKKLVSVVDKFERTKLKNFEVIVTNVTVNSRKIIQAQDLVK